MDLIHATASTSPDADRPPTVVIDGDLDHCSLPQVAEQLDEALASRPAEVVVDLEDCPYVDATGLAALVDTHRRARRAGTVLTLEHCSPRVLRLLSLTGLRRVFDLRT